MSWHEWGHATIKPLFKVGDTVFHVGPKRYAKVEEAFWGLDGWRYYVRHSGHTWSVPEGSLDDRLMEKWPEENPLVTAQKKAGSQS